MHAAVHGRLLGTYVALNMCGSPIISKVCLAIPGVSDYLPQEGLQKTNQRAWSASTLPRANSISEGRKAVQSCRMTQVARATVDRPAAIVVVFRFFSFGEFGKIRASLGK